MHLSTQHPDSTGTSRKTKDPRLLLVRRYGLMCLHFSILIALIFVATFEVRSAILLGINATSALIFIIYVPPSAWLTWREGRNGIGYGAKVKKKSSGKTMMGSGYGNGIDVESGAGLGGEEWQGRERRGWTWDCAGLEVAYLGIQCASTLVACILCALTLSSAQCYGPEDNTEVFVLDEFAQLKEGDAAHWCHGVIGATVLSFIQFGLDLAWLGWVVSVVRAGSGVRSDNEGMELSRRISMSVHPDPTSPISPVSPLVPTSTHHNYLHYHPRPHVYHLLQTLLTPTPRLLAALAQRRSEEAVARQHAGPTFTLSPGSDESSLPSEERPQAVQQIHPAGILMAETDRARDIHHEEEEHPAVEHLPAYTGMDRVPVYPGRT